MMCLFIEKTKFRVLDAKKNCGELKYSNQTIYINDHLSPHNRGLFADVTTAKRDLGFKYLWVRNGTILMRKTDRSPLIRIIKAEDIRKLASTHVSENLGGEENGGGDGWH